MKKVIAGILTCSLTVALCIFMAACSASFNGTYKFYSMSMNTGGVSINYEVGKEYMGVTISEDAFTLTVNDDNTWSMSMKMMGANENAKGTWEEKDGKYYLTTEGETQAMEVTVDGKKITFEQDGAKIVLKK